MCAIWYASDNKNVLGTHVNMTSMKFPSFWWTHRAEPCSQMRTRWLMRQVRFPLQSTAGWGIGFVQFLPGHWTGSALGLYKEVKPATADWMFITWSAGHSFISKYFPAVSPSRQLWYFSVYTPAKRTEHFQHIIVTVNLFLWRCVVNCVLHAAYRSTITINQSVNVREKR